MAAIWVIKMADHEYIINYCAIVCVEYKQVVLPNR